MKAIFAFLVIALIMFSAIPLAIAEGNETEGGIGIEIKDPENECPIIHQDHTQRSWYPNDQTVYTATEYGNCDTNLYGDASCEVEDRGNYVFAGETLTYYVIVEDPNGDDDIEKVVLEGLGACLEITPPTDGFPTEFPTWEEYSVAKFGIDEWNDGTMNLYKCKIIVPKEETSYELIEVKAEDDALDLEGETCSVNDEKEQITFNPEIQVALAGTINFGNVTAGSVATSNTIKIQNLAMNEDGVVMDMYIASDDYFTADDEDAICGDGNGIKYDRFSYYATKGSVNSGKNNNDYPGLGDDTGICAARADEYTQMPSHSGHIEDMCRVINHLPGTFLTQGDFMSLTLRLDVPENCEPYAYTNGKFHVVGRVV